MQGENGKNYAVGRGEVYFDRFADGTQNVTGELYLGNTPEFNTTSETEELEHFDSDHGLNEKDDSVTLSNARSGNFTTDNISVDNIALFFSGAAGQTTYTSATAQTAVIIAKQGRYFQLGVTTQNPAGVRHITNVSVALTSAPSTPITATGNWEADLDLGRIYIEPGSSAIAENASITVTYDRSASSLTTIISGNDQIEGALRFVSYNPKGVLMDYFWPRVRLSPNGDFALKSGDDWQTIPFNVEFLKKGSLETVYITTRGTSA
jgi:hypothetical protein